MASRLIQRTYASAKRKRLPDYEDYLKRRRVEDASFDSEEEDGKENLDSDGLTLDSISSSVPPSDQAAFSDDLPALTTPPSSPPLPPTEPNIKLGSSIESWSLGIPESSREPFAPISNNACSKPTYEAPKPKPRLVQMQINLGGPTQKKCRVCGMEYVPSSAEDAALHKKFHAQNVDGLDLGREWLKKNCAQPAWRRSNGDMIIAIDGKDGHPAKRRARTALDLVQAELGAVPIPDQELWASAGDHFHSLPGDDDGSALEAGCSVWKHKVYLYVRGSRCIGFCLAERISEAFKVMENGRNTCRQPGSEMMDGRGDGRETCSLGPQRVNGQFSLESVADVVAMGISRIWCCNKYRKDGIATALLDCARGTFRRGCVVPKDQIAFSQPTESGKALARKWFGSQTGWHVYLS